MILFFDLSSICCGLYDLSSDVVKVSGIRKGSIFPKIRAGEVLKSARLQSFSYDQKTMDQWVTDSNGLVTTFHLLLVTFWSSGYSLQ